MSKPTITFSRAIRVTPCDCQDGPCGWAHHEHCDCPPKYFIDGRPATRAEVEEAMGR